MRKVVRVCAGILSCGVISLLALTISMQYALPDTFTIAQGEEFIISSKVSITAEGILLEEAKPVSMNIAKDYRMNLKLFSSVPIKQVSVNVVERKMVVPGGTPFGIKMFTEGVMVVGMSDIQVGSQNHNPAKDAGLKIGDIITHIDGMQVIRNSDVARCIARSGGEPVKIDFTRNDQPFTVYLEPIESEYEQSYKAGIWVRDSSAGIGTLTYYDPENKGFAGLGHAVCDVDTGTVMPLSKGEIVDVNISGVNIGESGKPGELKGAFVGASMGNLILNCEAGIFGVLDTPYFGNEVIPMALKQEIQPGPAVILSTISGNKPQRFDIEIEKVSFSDTSPTKNMVIRITDERLLAATGGIVQGMSGSPIIQNDKLVGAVTHVFVNDPTRGYGIFAESMNECMKKVDKTKIAA